jgi:hypothetical protein
MVTTAPVLADGDFYVVAVGGGVGTKITSLPYTINSPGFYYLGGNLTCDSGSGICINSNDVTLDLMGFRFSGNSGGDGIYTATSGFFENVVVRNGSLRGWNKAIKTFGAQHRIINVGVQANAGGIILSGFSHQVKGCTAINNTDSGIQASNSTISNNHVTISGTEGNYGILGSGIISGNEVNNYNYGIFCNGQSNVINNMVFCNTTAGITLPTGDPSVVDQNNVMGATTARYAGGSTLTVWVGKNSDTPWGSNAGHQ